MAFIGDTREFIQSWEGGLSRNAADSASAFPAPWTYKGLTGWHTNKGVTYKTFVGLAAKCNYAVTAENFFNMPNDIWDKIIKVGYWDQWYLDKLTSQAIAVLILDFAWGSGVNGSFQSIRKYLESKGTPVNSQLEAVKELNKLSLFNEEKTFLELIAHREKFFRGLASFSSFGNGWLNRLNKSTDAKRPSLQTYGLALIQKKKS